MMQTRNYFTLPPIVNGYPLDDRISVVVPVARTNLVINPSFETNTTSWTAIGGSIARSTSFQYHGAYSLAVTPTAATTDGVRYDTVSLVSGTAYAYSCKVLGIAGKSYKIALETTAGVELASITFVASGRWQWVYGYYTESSTTTRRLTLRKAGGTELSIFYIDGAQVEALAAGETVSTYLDGSQQGLLPNQNPVAYYWNGTPHASTSVRSALTRAGGMVVSFRYFGFFLTALIGLGLAPPQNVATEYARIDGGYDDYTRKPTRQFTITGNFESRAEYLSLRQQRGGLSRLLDRDLVAQDQRLVLMRDVVDECGAIGASTCRLLGKYQGGLEGSTDNHIASVAPITFTQYLGVVLSDGESGGALDVQDSIANADYFMKRSPAGAWSVPGGGTGAVVRMLQAPDGSIYIAGNFANWGGNASADNIVKYDPTTGLYSACSTGTNGEVDTLAVLPDGKIVLGGAFTLAGGVANTARIAVYDPVANTFAALGTGASTNSVLALAVDSTGNIYAGGSFGAMGGVANTLRLAKWTGAAWTALSTGADGEVDAIVIGIDRNVYITGQFTNLGAVAALQIGYWNTTSLAFVAMGTGLNSTGGRALAVGPNGLIYVGGIFTSAGGVSGTGHVAQWNGVTFQGLGGGLNGDVVSLSAGPNGILLAAGQFTGVTGGATFPDGAAAWNGAAWTTIGVDTPAISGRITSVLLTSDNSMYMAYNGTGTATSEGVVTITNPGTARSYPTIILNGPTSGTSRIWSLINYTTNKSIYLNLTLNAGEVATLIFTPDNLSFTTTFQVNVASAILPGSNTAEFYLNPGANSFATFAAVSTVVGAIYDRPAYLSLDDVP